MALVRGILDEVFGSTNFVSQIAFLKTTSATSEFLPSVCDYVLWFAKDKGACAYFSLFRKKQIGGEGSKHYNSILLADGTRIPATADERDGAVNLPEGASLITADQLQSAGMGREKGEGAASWFKVEYEGQVFTPTGQTRWKTNEDGMRRLGRASRIIGQKTALRYLRKFDDFSAFAINNVWTDVGGAAEKSYVVETAPRVIERCILMTTKPGDLVLDPTCGGGTTAYVAEEWGRRWITIDTSRVALTLARARLIGAKYDYYLLKDSKDGAEKEGEIIGKPPADGPFANNIRHGFVYERAPHVMLKTIADDAEIDVVWERWQNTLEPLRERLNKALKKSWQEWEIPREAGDPWSRDATETFYGLRAAIGKNLDTAKLLDLLNKQLGRNLRLDQLPQKPLDRWPEEPTKMHGAWWEARHARQKEIDDSIARNAEVEYLYDRPYKARGVVRVAGPFTVESLSPHRVLPMGEDPYFEELLAADGADPSILPSSRGGRGAPSRGDPSSEERMGARVKPGHDSGGMVTTDFAQVVYESLKTAGVQNTKKGERLMLENLRPFASKSGRIAFQGEYRERRESKRAAVCIGPEYDTVGYDLVRAAAKEAVDLFDTLIVCGFAFAPEVDDTRLNFGSLTVLKARMNQDLRMADKLKATGAGNLFVVFGEPDIVIHKLKDDLLKVEIRGMDIFDPTTGEVRSSGGKDLMNDVAAWFVDNDYDEDSFFVRQAYFVGDDPYDGLKRALKAEIDETAWAELNSTVSRPFPRPKHGRICVKVINHFGDEVQKVFQV